MNKNSDTNDDVRASLLKYLDDALQPAERTRVETLLAESRETRDLLRELAMQAVVIADCERTRVRTQPELPWAESSSTDRTNAVRQLGRSNSVIVPWVLAAAAICACVALAWRVVWPGYTTSEPSAAMSDREFRLAEVRFARDAKIVAKPSTQQVSEKWFGEGARLGRGVYVLEHGFVELEFYSGVALAVEGPATMELISQREARLLSGRVTVEAGNDETTFLLHTPVGEVLDIGTRYGVVVDADGATETHVFEGLVDVRPNASRESVRRVEAATALRVTKSGVVELAPASESAFPQPSRRISGMLVDPDFEPGTPLHVGQPEVGNWGGDICRIVATEQGVLPFSGQGMLLFQSTGQNAENAAATAASQLSQWIDLAPYEAAIVERRVRARLSARFNRVSGNERTDSQFSIHLEAFAATPGEAVRRLKSQPDMPRSRVSYQLLSDSDPTSWEEAEAVLTVPADARFLQVTIFAFENVSNDEGSNAEFDGHFADNLQFELIIEPAPSNGHNDHH